MKLPTKIEYFFFFRTNKKDRRTSTNHIWIVIPSTRVCVCVCYLPFFLRVVLKKQKKKKEKHFPHVRHSFVTCPRLVGTSKRDGQPKRNGLPSLVSLSLFWQSIVIVKVRVCVLCVCVYRHTHTHTDCCARATGYEYFH